MQQISPCYCFQSTGLSSMESGISVIHVRYPDEKSLVLQLILGLELDSPHHENCIDLILMQQLNKPMVTGVKLYLLSLGLLFMPLLSLCCQHDFCGMKTVPLNKQSVMFSLLFFFKHAFITKSVMHFVFLVNNKS